MEDEGEWCLERAVVGQGSGGNDEAVEEDSEGGETDEDAGDSFVDEEEVVGEGATKEEESGLEHEGQTFHDEVEMPGDHPVHLALTMPTAINNGPAHLHLGVTVEPLLAQHGDERGEEGSCQT